MKQEAEKGTKDSDWFSRAITEYTISEFADFVHYPGANKEARGQILLRDFVDWAELPPGKTLASVGRTCWKDYQPVVERRKKRGEYVLTLYGKTLAYEWAAWHRDD